MALQTDHLDRCLATLESSLALLLKEKEGTIEREVFRNATVKGFELTLETAGKLLRKALKTFGASPRSVDALSYNEVLKEAGRRALFDLAAVERWIAYRENRNDTAHDYGEFFAEETVKLLPSFLDDARALSKTLTAHFAQGAP